MMKPSILLIYTGGTIGMMEDAASKSLKPFNFRQISNHIPELKSINTDISTISFDHPIDSSNMSPQVWIKLAKLIAENYRKYDGFVILHGSDTMAFTASALSFMLENLNKPVILTGSQLPMGILRTDGKENLITAIEIAAKAESGKALVPEVAIYFEYQLYRGNRTHKFNSEHFQAFQTANYPVLAEAGVHIKFNKNVIHKNTKRKLLVHTKLNTNIAVLKLFPGISKEVVESVLTIKGLKAVLLETFGSGNAPTDKWFINLLKKAIENEIIIFNITQCNSGSVQQGKYETSMHLKEIGVIGGGDITYEAAITKLMFLLGSIHSKNEIRKLLSKSIRGEIS